jgi:peptidoglycan biosynthesis protein MviN/MurJ (putative lipid II flippase)
MFSLAEATNMKRVDLEVAVAAGLAVVLPLYKIFTLPGTCDSPNPLTLRGAAALLLILASYLSVTLLVGLLRGPRVIRFVWLWTAILGSLLSVVVLYCLAPRSKDWDLELSAKVWLALCVWTLLFAAIVYYSGMIITGIRRRHERPKEKLSI